MNTSNIKNLNVIGYYLVINMYYIYIYIYIMYIGMCPNKRIEFNNFDIIETINPT